MCGQAERPRTLSFQRPRNSEEIASEACPRDGEGRCAKEGGKRGGKQEGAARLVYKGRDGRKAEVFLNQGEACKCPTVELMAVPLI